MFLKAFFKAKIKANLHKKVDIDFNSYSSFLISIFSRYGDGVIALKVLKEFKELHQDKKFLIITTPHFAPYANEFFPNCVVALNKRNPIALLSTIQKIKAFNADIGLNPWSFGDESKFFISYAKQYKDFVSFREFSKIDNLYDRVRYYLNLPIPKRKICNIEISSDIKNIIFVPFSTDITKNLDINDALKIIEDLKQKYQKATIWLCGFKNEIISFSHDKKIYFKRSINSSKQFLELIKFADLFVGVDSGPLHLGMIFNKRCIGIFGPTTPQTVVDTYENTIIWRTEKLNGIFCFVENCKNPVCLQNGFSQNLYIGNCALETTECKYQKNIY